MAAVLRTLARLSAAEQPQKVQLDLTKAAGLLWHGDHEPSWRAITLVQEGPKWTPIQWTALKQARAEVEHLAAYDALHQEDRVLRLGWAFLVGPAQIGGQRRRVCLPLVSRPVRLHHGIGLTYIYHVAGDAASVPADRRLGEDRRAGGRARPDQAVDHRDAPAGRVRERADRAGRPQEADLRQRARRGDGLRGCTPASPS